MPEPLVIVLTARQRDDLEWARAKHPLPYMRERSTAILKVADGCSGLSVARTGLLKPRWPDTVYEWVKRYKADGLAGLLIKPGRGRKPAFSPSVPGRAKRTRSAAARHPARTTAVRSKRLALDFSRHPTRL